MNSSVVFLTYAAPSWGMLLDDTSCTLCRTVCTTKGLFILVTRLEHSTIISPVLCVLGIITICETIPQKLFIFDRFSWMLFIPEYMLFAYFRSCEQSLYHIKALKSPKTACKVFNFWFDRLKNKDDKNEYSFRSCSFRRGINIQKS